VTLWVEKSSFLNWFWSVS